MKKNFLSVTDMSPKDLGPLLSAASRMKKNPFGKQLRGKSVALLFEKPSTRTRVSFEVGISQLGGQPVYIDAGSTQLSRGERIEDFSRVMERYVDCICARVFEHKTLEAMAGSAAIPVVNMLSDAEHPCQILADLFAVREKFGRLEGLKMAYIGDGNNVANSLLLGCAMAGMDFSAASPAGYSIRPGMVSKAERIGSSTGSKIEMTAEPKIAAKEADIIYSDVFVSMGAERETEGRLKAFWPKYMVTEKVMGIAKKRAVYMHCLPAHRGQEVSAGVIDGPQSIAFDQAEARLHVQKALLVWLLK